MYKKIREKDIDIARGIAIILVVMGHCDNFELWSIEKFSSLFFMQLFIFLSGIFFNKNEINNFKDLFTVIKKKCLPIYLYYLKYEVVFYLLTNLFIKIGFYNPNLLYGGKTIGYISLDFDFVKNIFKIIFLMGREPFCGAFWFLVTLIFVVCEYSVINYIANRIFKNLKYKKVFLNIIVLLMFFIGCIMNKTVNIPRISPSFTLILFYHLGNIYNFYKNKIKFNNVIIFLVCIILLNVLYYFGMVSMNSNQFTNPIFLIACSTCGIYMVMYLSNLIEKKSILLSNLLSYIGQHTLPIVALQFISFKAVMLIQYLFGNILFDDLGLLKGANNNNFIYIFYVMCGVFIPLLLNQVYMKVKKRSKSI